jgi:tetratricopeptide (TPR) repeat protein
MFVNVEGAEKRAREAKRKAELAERQRHEAERAEERKAHAEKMAEQKKLNEARRAEKREENRIKREDFALKVRENRKTIRIWVIVGLIVLAGLITAGIFGIRAIIRENKVAKHEEYNNKTSQAILDSDAANVYFQDGNYQAGMDAYDELIDNAPNEESKAALHLQRAIAIAEYFEGDSELDQALKDAYEAEKVHPNSLSAETIAGIERRKGNEETAQIYDQFAAERLEEDLDPRQGEG